MAKKRIVDDKFSQKIALIAKEKFGTQKKMAEAIGVAPSNVSDWTKGKMTPSLKVLRELCKEANVSLDWLILDIAHLDEENAKLTLKTDEHRLLDLYRSSSSELRTAAFNVLNTSKGNIENIIPNNNTIKPKSEV